MNFGVGQISSLDQEELDELKEQIVDYMKDLVKGKKMSFFLLTNILKESSMVVFAGEGAKDLMEKAFGHEPEEENCIFLEGVVSRKKQFLPKVLYGVQL